MKRDLKRRKIIGGTIEVPWDKSVAHRVALFSLLSENKISVSNFPDNQDCLSSLDAVKSLGVKVEKNNGDIVLFDAEHYDNFIKYKCHSNNGYANKCIGNGKIISMHRLILGLKNGDVAFVDQKNSKKLDNRRSNIRLCTKDDNQRNIGIRSNNTSGFKGVSKHHTGRWCVYINYKCKRYFLGLFDEKKAAAKAYNKAAAEYFGTFAYLNTI